MFATQRNDKESLLVEKNQSLDEFSGRRSCMSDFFQNNQVNNLSNKIKEIAVTSRHRWSFYIVVIHCSLTSSIKSNLAKNTQNPRRKKPKKYQLFANFTETNCENLSFLQGLLKTRTAECCRRSFGTELIASSKVPASFYRCAQKRARVEFNKAGKWRERCLISTQ